MKVLFFAFCLLFGLNEASALNVEGATITSLSVRSSDGLVMFYWSGGVPNGSRPSCGAGYSANTFTVKDENSVAGKSQLAVLLTARALGKTVNLSGMGNCIRWGDIETINQITF